MDDPEAPDEIENRAKGKRIEKIVRLARKGRKSLAILVDARETCWACIYGRYRGAERT